MTGEAVHKYIKKTSPLCLHVGCGPLVMDGFLNLDINDHHNPEKIFKIDVCSLSDIVPADSVDVIWCCHMIEHLNYVGEADWALKQFYYVLKTGGWLRLAVPDLKKVSAMYVSGNWHDLRDIYGDGHFHYGLDCPGERYNFFLREWGHRIVYDAQMLTHKLIQAGFKTPKEKKMNESEIPGGWVHDRLEGESLYMEVQK